MAGPITPNYGWQLAEDGGDVGLWGIILNSALEEIDADLAAVQATADAAFADGDNATFGRLLSSSALVARTAASGQSGTVSYALRSAPFISVAFTGSGAVNLTTANWSNNYGMFAWVEITRNGALTTVALQLDGVQQLASTALFPVASNTSARLLIAVFDSGGAKFLRVISQANA